MSFQKKVTLPSGHELVVNPVPFKLACALRRLVASELVKINVEFSEGLIPALLLEEKDPAKRRLNVIAALSGTDANTLKNLVLQLLASEEIEACVIACMKTWVLDGDAVKAETFEPEDRRGDLIPAAVEVGKSALLPFFASLGLPSTNRSGEAESKSQG